jgi:hypothetical protein
VALGSGGGGGGASTPCAVTVKPRVGQEWWGLESAQKLRHGFWLTCAVTGRGASVVVYCRCGGERAHRELKGWR